MVGLSSPAPYMRRKDVLLDHLDISRDSYLHLRSDRGRRFVSFAAGHV